MFNVEILKDSIGPSKQRLTTWLLTYPRFIHSELLTHKIFSKNSASSRAIRPAVMWENLKKDPVMPVWWGKEQPGMSARAELDEPDKTRARITWVQACKEAIEKAQYLSTIGLHKQITNRITEPWMWITVILTATSFSNLFRLRNHPDAQPEFQYMVKQMVRMYKHNTPTVLQAGEWHIPYDRVTPEDVEVIKSYASEHQMTDSEVLRAVATGRIARVSYLTHDGKRDVRKDIELSLRLSQNNPPHLSPFEHVAQAMSVDTWNQRCQQFLDQARENNECFNPGLLGNIVGWLQLRKTIPNEHGFDFDWEKTLNDGDQ